MTKPTSSSRRFVVLRHETPPNYPRGLHWDFMVEVDGALRTWALAREPVADTAIEAEELPAHRLEYLEFEGAVSGDRGTVVRWDQGTCAVLRDDADHLELKMHGQRLRGVARGRRSDPSAQRWTFSFDFNSAKGG